MQEVPAQELLHDPGVCDLLDGKVGRPTQASIVDIVRYILPCAWIGSQCS